MTAFGDHVRSRREELRQEDKRFSLRQVAQRIGVEPAYLSKIERGDMPPPSEATTVRLAKELGEDPDVMLAMAGKVSSDLQGAAKESWTFAAIPGRRSRWVSSRSIAARKALPSPACAAISLTLPARSSLPMLGTRTVAGCP